VPSIINDLGKGIKDGVSFIVEKTDEWTKLGKLNVDLINLKREMDRRINLLGTRTLNLYEENGLSMIALDPRALQLIAEIGEYKERIDLKRKEMASFK
jgi:hypothetical protein